MSAQPECRDPNAEKVRAGSMLNLREYINGESTDFVRERKHHACYF